jgi:hypothetical protein
MCHTFLEPQAQADLNNDGNIRNIRNLGMLGIMGILGMLRFQECQDQVLYLFGTTRTCRFFMVVDLECL